MPNAPGYAKCLIRQKVGFEGVVWQPYFAMTCGKLQVSMELVLHGSTKAHIVISKVSVKIYQKYRLKYLKYLY